MSVLVCGSMTFDTIMAFDGDFSSHVLPEHIDVFNVAFTAKSMRKEYGGCAGNICYGLNLLGSESYPVATVGSDFGLYFDRMKGTGVPSTYVKVVEGKFTAQSFITTDRTGNQISTFYPGAMTYSDSQDLASIINRHGDITMGVISPDSTNGMVQHASQFQKLEVPFLFDPGQEVIALSKQQLVSFIAQAKWMIVNAYEWQVIKDVTGLDKTGILNQLDALIITRGVSGSEIHTKDEVFMIKAVPVASMADPTGCGDAYRAGVIYGLVNGVDWLTTGRVASLMGAVNAESSGAQNHRFTRDEFFDRYEEHFGTPVALAIGQ